MELKPCPFCGGEATLHDESDCGDGWMVYCPSNECSIAAETMRYEKPQHAIEAWNTRVNDMTDEQRSHLTRLAEEMVDVLALSGGGYLNEYGA